MPSGEPGIALMIVEEFKEAMTRRFALLPEQLRIKTNHQLSIETIDKAMRSSCKGSSRHTELSWRILFTFCVSSVYLNDVVQTIDPFKEPLARNTRHFSEENSSAVGKNDTICQQFIQISLSHSYLFTIFSPIHGVLAIRLSLGLADHGTRISHVEDVFFKAIQVCRKSVLDDWAYNKQCFR